MKYAVSHDGRIIIASTRRRYIGLVFWMFVVWNLYFRKSQRLYVLILGGNSRCRESFSFESFFLCVIFALDFPSCDIVSYDLYFSKENIGNRPLNRIFCVFQPQSIIYTPIFQTKKLINQCEICNLNYSKHVH